MNPVPAKYLARLARLPSPELSTYNFKKMMNMFMEKQVSNGFHFWLWNVFFSKKWMFLIQASHGNSQVVVGAFYIYIFIFIYI